MLQYLTDNLLNAPAEALVNTVNTVGVMGKGIAQQFKETFQDNNKAYIAACKKGELSPGKLLAVWDSSNILLGKKLIINFPTKVHWRQPSKYEYIELGLVALRQLLVDKEVKSVAIPPLGCGNGGLDWAKVKPMIQEHLKDLPIDILVYEPNATVKELLQRQEIKTTVKLTPSRAQLLYALFAYESLGEDSSLFSANKIAYFLQRMGQPLRLDFVPHHYGPYAIGVQKVLYSMNGVYIKGLEQQKAKAFEPLKLNYEKWFEVEAYVKKELKEEEYTRLQNLLKFISGFHSELALEILASVDFTLEKNSDYSFEQVMHESTWTTRKKELFKREYVQIAYDHLMKYRSMAI